MGENMTDVLLHVENLHVSVGDTPIIQGISLEIKRGEMEPENPRWQMWLWATLPTK